MTKAPIAIGCRPRAPSPCSAFSHAIPCVRRSSTAERLTTELIRTVDGLFARFPLNEENKAQRARAVDQRARVLAEWLDAQAARDSNGDDEAWRLKPCPSLMFVIGAGELDQKHDQDLRDTCVMLLDRAGCDLLTICDITGHSYRSAQTIVKHYRARNADRADAGIDPARIAGAQGRDEGLIADRPDPIRGAAFDPHDAVVLRRIRSRDRRTPFCRSRCRAPGRRFDPGFGASDDSAAAATSSNISWSMNTRLRAALPFVAGDDIPCDRCC